jgi:hypothetical protein
VDRSSGDDIAREYPAIRTAAVENRRFMIRAVTELAAQRKIRQFLDIGTGLPVAPNVHDIAHRVDPAARVSRPTTIRSWSPMPALS